MQRASKLNYLNEFDFVFSNNLGQEPSRKVDTFYAKPEVKIPFKC
jgi:hypothetical protein